MVPKINLFLPSTQQTQGQTSQGTGARTPAIGKPFEKFIEFENGAAHPQVPGLALFGLPAQQAGLPPALSPASSSLAEFPAAQATPPALAPVDRPVRLATEAEQHIEPSGVKTQRTGNGLIAAHAKAAATLTSAATGMAQGETTITGQTATPASIAAGAPVPTGLPKEGLPLSGSTPVAGVAALEAKVGANNGNAVPAGQQAAAFLSPEGNPPPSPYIQPAQPGNPAPPFSPLLAAAVQSHLLAGPPPEEQDAAVPLKAALPAAGAAEGGVLVADTQKPLPISAMPAKASPASAILGQVIEQLSLRVKEGQSEIHLKLDPPSLGSVRMNVAAIGDQVRAVIITDHHAVKQVIESQLSELRSNLAGQGVKVDSFTVLVGGHDSGGGSRPEAEHAGFSGFAPGEAALPALEMENPVPPPRTGVRGGSSISIFV